MRYMAECKYTRDQAYEAALRLTAAAEPGHQDSVARLMPEYLNYLEQGTNAASTLEIKRITIANYVSLLGKFQVRDIKRQHLAKHWEQIGPHAWDKHRTLWIGFLKWCISKGYAEVNEAEATLRPQNLERRRQRHNPEGIAAIREAADDWLEIVIDLAIYSLQDRSTLLSAKRDDVIEDGSGYRWRCVRSKTESALEIHAPKGSKLYGALKRALAYEVTGSYLVRRPPLRRVPTNERNEWSQVLPDQLTKEFARARTRSGAYAEMEANVQPPFHGLRAYGSWLYEQAGIPTESVQALMAHKTVAMTQHYQDGHDATIRYVPVQAGL